MTCQLVQVALAHSDPGNLPLWAGTNRCLTSAIRPWREQENGSYDAGMGR
jgi:hypothetical protein